MWLFEESISVTAPNLSVVFDISALPTLNSHKTYDNNYIQLQFDFIKWKAHTAASWAVWSALKSSDNHEQAVPEQNQSSHLAMQHRARLRKHPMTQHHRPTLRCQAHMLWAPHTTEWCGSEDAPPRARVEKRLCGGHALWTHLLQQSGWNSKLIEYDIIMLQNKDNDSARHKCTRKATYLPTWAFCSPSFPCTSRLSPFVAVTECQRIRQFIEI